MPPSIHRSLAAASGIAFALVAYDTLGQGWRPTTIEIAQLPRFCWAQLQVPNVQGPEFSIVDCGPGANHFCSGLMYMIRAKGHMTDKRGRLDLLARADGDVRYTERAIADYPKCSIRDSVAATRAELDNLMTIYGYKRPMAK
jgi:hypothetical protein